MITKSIMAELLLSKPFINDNISSSSNKFLLIEIDYLLFCRMPLMTKEAKNIIVINFNGF